MPKGSLVLWDNRLPHATQDKLAGQDTREVVYCAFLPSVDLNRSYCAKQLALLKANRPPTFAPDAKQQKADLDFDLATLQPREAALLGMTTP